MKKGLEAPAAGLRVPAAKPGWLGSAASVAAQAEPPGPVVIENPPLSEIGPAALGVRATVAV
jgi:hypothetical protein